MRKKNMKLQNEIKLNLALSKKTMLAGESSRHKIDRGSKSRQKMSWRIHMLKDYNL